MKLIDVILDSLPDKLDKEFYVEKFKQFNLSLAETFYLMSKIEEKL